MIGSWLDGERRRPKRGFQVTITVDEAVNCTICASSVADIAAICVYVWGLIAYGGLHIWFNRLVKYQVESTIAMRIFIISWNLEQLFAGKNKYICPALWKRYGKSDLNIF